MNRKDLDRFYADNTGLIHTVARKGYGRLQAIGAAIEYEDVVQELTEVFIKSFDGFDEATGNKFSSYFIPAAYRKLNRIAEVYETERLKLGIHSIEEIESWGGKDDGQYSMEEIISGNFASIDDQIGAGRLARSIVENLSPVASMIVQMAIDPPEFMEREFSATQAHAEHARDLGIERRARGSLNMSFVCAVLEKTTELPAPVIRAAKKEVMKAVRGGVA